MTSDAPVRKPSSPSLAAVGAREAPKLSPEAADSLMRTLGAKAATMDITLEQLLTEMSRQTVLMRALKHDHEIVAATVEKLSTDQHIIKELLTEVLARLPAPA